jgi:hypothetical protein
VLDFKDPKTAKAALKLLLAGVSMLAYGAIHRTDKKLSAKLDEYFAEPESEETPED